MSIEKRREKMLLVSLRGRPKRALGMACELLRHTSDVVLTRLRGSLAKLSSWVEHHDDGHLQS